MDGMGAKVHRLKRSWRQLSGGGFEKPRLQEDVITEGDSAFYHDIEMRLWR